MIIHIEENNTEQVKGIFKLGQGIVCDVCDKTLQLMDCTGCILATIEEILEEVASSKL